MSTDAANVKTPGYKFQKVIQSTLKEKTLVNYLGGPKLDKRNQAGKLPFGNQVDEVYRSFEPGAVSVTNSNTNISINDDALFTVRSATGETLYTRNGDFTTNQQNELVTQEGDTVLAAGGNSIKVNHSDFTVNANGVINGTGQQLMLTRFADTAALESVGDTLFRGTGGIPAGNSTVTQYALEDSNVNTADVMVDMMQIARDFESNQKVLHTLDETLQKAANEIGRV
ncbi:MAG: flagellar hook-basal body complex protein [Pisciglobus halotolerans]|nr:flagellar hook-basal body complex protein [Pisciglobus halotolerans]